MIDKSNGETVSEPILKVIVADDDVFINRLLCSTVEGMGYQTAGATTGKETIELARANENSLILLDFQLSDYTAIQVVEQLAKNKIERPFIIITGKGNEQIAVEMMKMGAIDYLVKDQHLADMIPQILTKAVNNMRNEAALKKAEERIRNSERKYRELFEKMYNGVGVFARSREDGSFSSVDFNESGAKILARSREELIGKNLTEIFPGCSEGALCSAFNSAYSSGRTEYAPVIVYKDKQIERWLTFAVSRLPSGDVMAVFEDKTKQMRSEHALLRSERRYRSVVDDAPAFIARFAPGGETTFVNETLAKYLGSKPKHLLGTNFFEFISEEDREPFGETLKGITKETPVAAAERRISAKSGETAWIKWIVRGIFDDDALTEIQAVGQDVTESLNAQRELAKSEERFKTASLLTSDLIYERNLKDGSVSLYLDKNSLERSEKADFPATLEEWRERAHPEDAEKMESALKRALEESSPVETEYRLRRPDGTYAYWRDKSVAVKDESGVPVKIIGAASDATRRREIEEALKKSEAKYRQIFDNAAIAIFRSRVEDGVVIECNEKFAEFFGYADKSEAAGKISMLQHYADLSKRETMLRACIEKNGVRDFETKFLRTDGTEAWGLLSARTLPGEKHVECAIVDITDRIKMLDRLRVSEDLYRKLMSASPDVVILIDKNGNVKYASNKTYHVFGIEDYQIQGTNIIKWISPEDRIKTLDKLKAAFEGDDLVQEEIALLRNNGEEFIGEINSSRIADAAGNTETVIAVIRDVTEKKRLRSEMKKNEAKYKLLFESASEGFMLLDDHAIVDCNARAGQIFDLSKSEMIGKFPWELSPPVQPDGRDSKAAGEKYIEAAYLVPQNFMWRHWRRDGSTIECNVSLRAITIDDKKFILVGVQDVTDRETALRELKASREHLSLITDSLPALIAHVDANLRYRFVNKAYAQMLGLPKERIVGSTIKELAGDAAFKAMVPYIMEVMSGKKA